MERYIYWVSGWFEKALLVAAVAWYVRAQLKNRGQRTDNIQRLFWRLYRVLSKPLDELIGLLGLEKPAAPSVSLAGVKADAIVLHWKPREQSKAVRHHVYINGVQGMSFKPSTLWF